MLVVQSIQSLAPEQSGVFLYCLLDRASSPGEVIRYHYRVNLNARVEREEPRFSDGWDLGSVLHIEENERCALPVVVREINGLWLQICHNGLDGRTEFSGLRGHVPGLNGDVNLQ